LSGHQRTDIEAVIAALDADLRAAKNDVDVTLIEAALALTPGERLDAAYGFLRDLVAIRERRDDGGGAGAERSVDGDAGAYSTE
jgi:hypothetical protein